MAQNKDGQERTEQATPKRIQDARKKGDVARSRELNTMLLLLVAAGGMMVLGDQLVDGLKSVMTHSFSVDRAVLFDPAEMPRFFLDSVLEMLATLTPFFILMTLVALLAPMALGGWVFSGQAIGVKWERLDPVKGLGRVFGAKGLVEMLKALAKFLLIAGVAVTILMTRMGDILNVGKASVHEGIADATSFVLWTFLAVSASTLLIAALDVPFQLWEHARKLKMTRQEIKDEFKESEGKPEVKARIRQLQQEVATRRMMEDVPKADVIVTNPTHYAVALRYDTENMSAPKVVAKGADLVAEKIREVGDASGVTRLSAPPLARALFHSTRIGQEIPDGLYLAVAQVLAYVFQLRQSGAVSGIDTPSFTNLPIPEEFKRDS